MAGGLRIVDPVADLQMLFMSEQVQVQHFIDGFMVFLLLVEAGAVQPAPDLSIQYRGKNRRRKPSLSRKP
jgi:hypothetical protein